MKVLLCIIKCKTALALLRMTDIFVNVLCIFFMHIHLNCLVVFIYVCVCVSVCVHLKCLGNYLLTKSKCIAVVCNLGRSYCDLFNEVNNPFLIIYCVFISAYEF